MPKPEISIIIVNYNTAAEIEKCLKSVQSSKFKVQNLEIIVVDNASADNSVEIIKKFKDVNLIQNSQNLGFAVANNIGSKAAIGDFLFFLNPDTELKKGNFDNLLEFAKKNPNAILGPKLLNPDGSIQGSCYNLPTITGAFREFWLGKAGAFEKFAPIGIEPVKVQAIVGAAVFCPKSIFEKLKGFDPKFFLYYEDLDFCRKAAKAGIKIFWHPGMEIIHHLGRSAVSRSQVFGELVKSSKVYHGKFFHYLITAVIFTGQKIFGRNVNF